MVTFAPTPRSEMRAAHQRARAAERRVSPEAGALNTSLVVDFGATTLFTFRGRAYAVPLLPMSAGLAIMTRWQAAAACGQQLDGANRERYYQALGGLPALLWRHCRPVGRWKRLKRAAGVMRNPFRQATEAELVELAAFFLTCRTKSGAGFPRVAQRA